MQANQTDEDYSDPNIVVYSPSFSCHSILNSCGFLPQAAKCLSLLGRGWEYFRSTTAMLRKQLPFLRCLVCNARMVYRAKWQGASVHLNGGYLKA